MSLVSRVIQKFTDQYGVAPAAVSRAPGRVNLIGEHTDYNEGFVMPMAIERAAYVALRPRTDSLVKIRSLDFNEAGEFDLGSLPETAEPVKREGWLEYVRGVAWALRSAGYPLQGWEGVCAGDVPIGAGLSSSAALELAVARAFAFSTGFPWDAKAIALLCQKAENQWVGVNTGIMDQMISAVGQAGRAVLIDCRSLDLAPAPLPEGTVVVILDTATRRELVTSAYNERRAQCEAAAAHFGVRVLRDVTLDQLNAAQAALDPVVFRRARHIVSENARTVEAKHAMDAGDAAELGRLMRGSHASLRDDFEVTNAALNAIVAIADAQPGCFGARMTGAGFGGCAVALVREDAAQAFSEAVSAAYMAETGLNPAIYVTGATDGANLL